MLSQIPGRKWYYQLHDANKAVNLKYRTRPHSPFCISMGDPSICVVNVEIRLQQLSLRPLVGTSVVRNEVCGVRLRIAFAML